MIARCHCIECTASRQYLTRPDRFRYRYGLGGSKYRIAYSENVRMCTVLTIYTHLLCANAMILCFYLACLLFFLAFISHHYFILNSWFALFCFSLLCFALFSFEIFLLFLPTLISIDAYGWMKLLPEHN